MLTDILSLTNSNLKFKPVRKDRLFYDRFCFCLGFILPEVSCLRELNHKYIDDVIKRRRQWRQVSLQHWGQNPNRNILARKDREITDDNVSNLHTLTDVLLRSRVDFKLVTSVNTAWIYTNDLQLLNTVDRLDFLILKQYTEAHINRPKDTIRLVKPEHENRAYLLNQKLTSEEKANLLNFFANQTEHIRVSPSLLSFLQGSFHRTQDYFFFDYTGDSWLVMLSLIRPGLIRKTMRIIAR